MGARGRRFACAAAVLATAAVLAPGAAGGHALTTARAAKVARETVLAHHSYRQITATRSGLVTRSCWRAAGAAVRCSLYVVTPNSCALQDDAGAVCAQALWERRWLVAVTRERRGMAARILRISSGPAA